MHILRDLFYTANNDPKQSLDLYIPDSPSSYSTLVIYFHGGAWRSGDKSLFHDLGSKFADLNYQTAVISYTLSLPPLNKIHPCHLQDCAEAVKWLCANCKLYFNCNELEDIYIVGQSAGAQLASNIFLEPHRYLNDDAVHAKIKGKLFFHLPPL